MYLVNFPGVCPVCFWIHISAFTTSFWKRFHRLILFEELRLVHFDEIPNSFISCSLTLVLSAKLFIFSTSPCLTCFCRTLPYVPFLILSSNIGGLANAILLILFSLSELISIQPSPTLIWKTKTEQCYGHMDLYNSTKRFSAFYCFFCSNS